MNKLSIIAKGAMITMGLAGVANANNFIHHSSLINNWTGFNAGVNGGLVFNNTQLNSQQIGFTSLSEHCNTSSDFSTYFRGIQLGYTYQFPNSFVSGIDANITFNTNQKNTLGCKCLNNPTVSDLFSFRNQKQSSIKGRVGQALNWNKNLVLPYFTAGASFAKVGLTYKNEENDYYSKNTTQAGWLIGTGIEWAFQKNWSLCAEYNFLDYGNIIKLKIPRLYGLIDPNGNAQVALRANTVAIAINYWI